MHSVVWDTNDSRQQELHVGISARKKAKKNTKQICAASPWTEEDCIVLRALLERAPRRKRTMESKRELKTHLRAGESSYTEQRPAWDLINQIRISRQRRTLPFNGQTAINGTRWNMASTRMCLIPIQGNKKCAGFERDKICPSKIFGRTRGDGGTGRARQDARNEN